MTRALLLVAVLFTLPAAAQPIVVGVQVGVDGNQVGGLAAWQGEDLVTLNRRGIPVVETDAFPAFLSVQAQASIGVGSSTRIGAHLGYGSTSGRLAYADYSGSARSDRLARRSFGGASAEYAVLRAGPATAWIGMSARLSRVTVDYERRIVVGSEAVEVAEAAYTGWPVGIEPAVAAEVALGPLATARVHAGWEQSFGGRLSGETPPRLVNGGAPAADWGGLRVGVGLAARIGGRR